MSAQPQKYKSIQRLVNWNVFAIDSIVAVVLQPLELLVTINSILEHLDPAFLNKGTAEYTTHTGQYTFDIFMAKAARCTCSGCY